MKRKSRILVPLVLAVASLSLTGCTNGALPTPKPSSPSPHPVFSTDKKSKNKKSEDKLENINKSIVDVLGTADASLDPNLLATRFSGPFLTQRRFEYQKKNLFGDAATLTALPTTVKYTAVSQSSTYPRLVVQIMDAPEGKNYRWLNVLVQPKARNNWTLWASMQIIQDASATAPSMSTGASGAEVVGPDDSKGLVASPNAVVDAYIKLNQTQNDANGLTFADDSFRGRIKEFQNHHAELVKDVGEASLEFSRGAQGPYAMRTADGGAVVFVELNHTTTIRVTKNGGSVSITDQNIIAATGEAKESISSSNSIAIHYTEALAFYVPPAGAKDTSISLIAVSGSTPFQVDIA